MREKNANRHRRLYKLKRMEMELDDDKNTKKEQKKHKQQENDMEELMNEIDRDPEVRKKMNLYKDQQTIDSIKKQRKEKY